MSYSLFLLQEKSILFLTSSWIWISCCAGAILIVIVKSFELKKMVVFIKKWLNNVHNKSHVVWNKQLLKTFRFNWFKTVLFAWRELMIIAACHSMYVCKIKTIIIIIKKILAQNANSSNCATAALVNGKTHIRLFIIYNYHYYKHTRVSGRLNNVESGTEQLWGHASFHPPSQHSPQKYNHIKLLTTFYIVMFLFYFIVFIEYSILFAKIVIPWL